MLKLELFSVASKALYDYQFSIFRARKVRLVEKVKEEKERKEKRMRLKL